MMRLTAVDQILPLCLASTTITVPVVNEAREEYHSYRTGDTDKLRRSPGSL